MCVKVCWGSSGSWRSKRMRLCFNLETPESEQGWKRWSIVSKQNSYRSSDASDFHANATYVIVRYFPRSWLGVKSRLNPLWRLLSEFVAKGSVISAHHAPFKLEGLRPGLGDFFFHFILLFCWLIMWHFASAQLTKKKTIRLQVRRNSQDVIERIHPVLFV